ncbi:MAG TPA: nucleotidyltransferase family protein [Burkholderiales bacterium]|nr:nucleotidyltransferase family protein [Burkholderiales bacterium]
MIGGLVLAAGRSRRFGGEKLLTPLADGTPVAVATTRLLVAALPQVVAVVRPASDVLATALRACGAQVVVCPDADEGMGTSLACGVRATPHWQGWLVALADMPCVAPTTVRALAAAIAGGAALAAPYYHGRRGHPVCFGERYRAALATLSGTHGARDVVAAAGDDLVALNCDDPGVLIDIDTPDDFARIAAGTPPPAPDSN